MTLLDIDPVETDQQAEAEAGDVFTKLTQGIAQVLHQTYQATGVGSAELLAEVHRIPPLRLAVATELRERAAAMRAEPERWRRTTPTIPGTWCAVLSVPKTVRCWHSPLTGNIVHSQLGQVRVLSDYAQAVAGDWLTRHYGPASSHGRTDMPLTFFNDVLATSAEEVAHVLEKAAADL